MMYTAVIFCGYAAVKLITAMTVSCNDIVAYQLGLGLHLSITCLLNLTATHVKCISVVQALRL